MLVIVVGAVVGAVEGFFGLFAAVGIASRVKVEVKAEALPVHRVVVVAPPKALALITPGALVTQELLVQRELREVRVMLLQV
jgi:hypothetical protein